MKKIALLLFILAACIVARGQAITLPGFTTRSLSPATYWVATNISVDPAHQSISYTTQGYANQATSSRACKATGNGNHGNHGGGHRSK